MEIRFEPSFASGVLTAPPSKSAAHRMLLCAALAGGVTRIDNLAFSEDILATIDCLQALGAQVKKTETGVRVRGINREKVGANAPARLCVRESGSTLRFFIPVCLALGVETVFTGSKTLFSRPLSVYESIAARQGICFEKGENSLHVRGALLAERFSVPGNVSSQFLSGLLFALPLLEADSALTVLPPWQSRPYLLLTLQALQRVGITIVQTGEYEFSIPGAQSYRPVSGAVEGDWSNAAYLEVFSLSGHPLRLAGLSPDSLQGDKVYREHFEALKRGFATIDLSDCPDLGPVLFAAAAAKNGARFLNTARLRIKESDRVSCMARELRKFGVTVQEQENEATVLPHRPEAPRETLYGHNDHRIVMALSYLLSITGGTLSGAEAVRKSFPDFFAVLRGAGVRLETVGEDRAQTTGE